MGQGQDLEQLIGICATIQRQLLAHGCAASEEAIVDAVTTAGIPSLLSAPVADPPPEPRRYSVRANPGIADGAMTTISFRVPASVRKIFEDRIAELKEAGDPAIQNQTDAGQDAIVRWCLMEGK